METAIGSRVMAVKPVWLMWLILCLERILFSAVVSAIVSAKSTQVDGVVADAEARESVSLRRLYWGRMLARVLETRR
jgi:hypothetical protein